MPYSMRARATPLNLPQADVADYVAGSRSGCAFGCAAANAGSASQAPLDAAKGGVRLDVQAEAPRVVELRDQHDVRESDVVAHQITPGRGAGEGLQRTKPRVDERCHQGNWVDSLCGKLLLDLQILQRLDA